MSIYLKDSDDDEAITNDSSEAEEVQCESKRKIVDGRSEAVIQVVRVVTTSTAVITDIEIVGD